MNKIKSLFKVEFSSSFQLSKFKDKSNRKRLALFILLMFLLLPNYLIWIKSLSKSFLIYEQISRTNDFILSTLINIQLISLFFSFTYMMSKFYYSRDLEYILALPIKFSYILSSKFFSGLIYSYFLVLILFLPNFIIYGKNIGFTPLYILYGLIIQMSISIYPIVIISIFLMLIIKYTNIRNKRDLLKNIFSFLFIGLVIFLQVKIQSLIQVESSNGQDIVANIVYASSEIVGKIRIFFPTAILGSVGLSRASQFNGLIYMMFYLLLNILIYYLFLKVGDKVYISGYLSLNEGSNRKKKSILELKKKIRLRKKYISIMLKEVIVIVKTPAYLLNIVSGVIIMPIVIGVPLYSDGTMKGELINLYGENKWIFILYLSIFISFLNITTPASTTFSREGKTMWLHRILPIDVKAQVKGRFLASILLIIFADFFLSIFLLCLLPINFIDLVILLFLVVLVSSPVILLAMLIDGSRPVLDWDNPQKAVKQNMNVLISMILTIVYLLILSFIIFIIKTNYIYAILTLALISIIFSMLIYKVIVKKFNISF